MDALANRSPRRQSRRLRLAVLISLLIHAMIAVLLVVTIRRKGMEELLPPPAPVTMLFETGRREGPTLPNPANQPSAPPSVATPPSEQAPLPTPPMPPVEPPQPTPQAATPPVPEPAPPPPVEQLPTPPVPAPLPPPAVEPAPLPPPPPALKPVPAQKPPPAKQNPPKPSDFPAPMNFSLGKPIAPSSAPARPRSSPHIPGTIDMSLGPASKGLADPTPYSDSDEGREGADYRNLLARWVAEHAYYPEQARRDGDEGDAKVHVVAASDGRVKEVELIGKSGSMWLDLALLSLFRDQHIPPYPGGGTEPIEFNFTMHYVLIRR
jgi:periplasmic protein TonB